MINAAARLGDTVVVGINDDDWLFNKKGYVYMTSTARKTVLASMRGVDRVIEFDSTDGTACSLIEQVLEEYPTSRIIFANGGDRTTTTTPEQAINDSRLSFVFGVGGDNKANSSSRLVDTPEINHVVKSWGTYRVYETYPDYKLKKLCLDPHSRTSLQSHQYRSEHFVCTQGIVKIRVGTKTHRLFPGDTVRVYAKTQHQVINDTDQPAELVEVQLGTCLENDITRYSN